MEHIVVRPGRGPPLRIPLITLNWRCICVTRFSQQKESLVSNSVPAPLSLVWSGHKRLVYQAPFFFFPSPNPCFHQWKDWARTIGPHRLTPESEHTSFCPLLSWRDTGSISNQPRLQYHQSNTMKVVFLPQSSLAWALRGFFYWENLLRWCANRHFIMKISFDDVRSIILLWKSSSMM